MSHFVSRIGAQLGNWNDRHARHDSRSEATLRWRTIDRISAWLHVKGDRP